MALAHHYKEADLLESIGWMGLSHEVRVKRVAGLYLKDEHNIRRHSQNYEGPTKGTVGLFVKSLFKPPHGLGSKTIKDTLNEIRRQRVIRDKRKKNQPYKPVKPPKSKYGVEARIKERRNNLARSRYSTIVKNYSGKKVKASPVVVGIGMVNDTLLIVDRGGHRALSRIYMKHKPTGRELVAVLEKDISSFMEGLTHIAPEISLRAMFGGQVITLDFEGRGFLVDGNLVPWRGIRRVYTQKRDGVIRTLGRPESQTD